MTKTTLSEALAYECGLTKAESKKIVGLHDLYGILSGRRQSPLIVSSSWSFPFFVALPRVFSG